MLLSACLAFILIFNESLGPLEALYKVLFRWDTDRYLRIAEYGYETSGHFEATIVFYPFYPLLIKFFQIVVHNYFVAGLLVSFAASFFSCIYLYRLCMLEFGKESVACTAVLLMLLCPTSIFFNMAYTESVFIFLTISTFYYFRTDCYVWAGIFAFCAALTKNQGVLLAIPFGFAGLHTYLTNQNIQHKPLIFLPTVFCLAGFGVYLLINKVMYGEWLKFMYYQQAGYSNSFGFFIHNLSGMYAMMLQENNMVMRYGTWVLSLITFFIALIILIKGTRLVPAIYSLYGLVFVIISYSPSWLISAPRYMMSLFVLYIIGAVWIAESRYRDSVLIMLACVLSLVNIGLVKGSIF